MRVTQIPELMSAVERVARGEGDVSELSQIIGCDDQPLVNLLRQAGCIDANSRVPIGVTSQRILNVILFWAALTALSRKGSQRR
ncbi:hypothetical protein ES705_43092 [subsurface metagenome]